MSTASVRSPVDEALTEPEAPQAARGTRWVLDGRGRRRAESSLQLSGLYCAACTGVIEAALLGVDGVSHAVADYGSRRATVRWDPARTSAAALLAALRRAGYDAAPDLPEAARALRRAEARQALWRLFVAAFCAMQVMMLAAPGYLAAPGDMADDLRRLLDWGAWLLSLPVLLFAATPFFAGAWRALRHRRIGMDVPVALGIVVTFVASSAAMVDPAGPFGSAVYFDSLTMFVSFLLLGRWLEMRLRHRAASALEAALGTMPETAQRVRPDGRDETVPVSRLLPGDHVRVPLGQAFPADGVLVEGRSQADESLLTGESRPVPKAPGSAVVGGSVNLGAPVVMDVQRCGADTRYEAIVALMREAASQRPAAARWADRWAAPFLWAVLLLAAAAAAVWSVIDPARAVWVAVSVLIVTCPCALSLATPSALLCAAQRLARHGVLLRRLDALEALAGIDRLFIDKTGTLTSTQPSLVRVQRLDAAGPLDESALLQRAASLARWSQHPLSRALARCSRDTLPHTSPRTSPHAPPHAPPGTPDGPVWRDVQEQPGQGLQARDEAGRLWCLGAAGPAADVAAGAATDAAADDEAGLVATLSCQGRPLAHFVFDETLAEGAAQAVAELRAQGVAVALLSGDAVVRVQRLAQRLGLDTAHTAGAATPQDKLAAVERAQARGERVGMVGDGVNDAPVLARADVSLAMGAGALMARASADAVIVSNRLGDLVLARGVARRTLRVIRQNIAWAAAYNAVCVPLALMGALPPWAAGLGMAASSLLVVANSMRLQR